MRRPAAAAVAGGGLVALAVVLSLLGRAVLATPTRVERAGPNWPARVQVARPPSGPFDRAASSLIAADRANAFTSAVRIYRDAIALRAEAGDPKGPVLISRLIPKLRSADERAQAWTMAGTLLAYSAGAGLGVVLPRSMQAQTQTVFDQAIDDFRDAVESNPVDEAAKFDLELMLAQRQASRGRASHTRRRRNAPTSQDRRRRSAETNGQEHHAGIYATGSGY